MKTNFNKHRFRKNKQPRNEEKDLLFIGWVENKRVNNNWSLLYAQRLAIEHQSSLLVVFNIVPHFLEATYQYDFMIKKVYKKLRKT